VSQAIELNKSQEVERLKNQTALLLQTSVNKWKSMTACFRMNDILFENTIQA
jgi:hypothetical protein